MQIDKCWLVSRVGTLCSLSSFCSRNTSARCLFRLLLTKTLTLLHLFPSSILCSHSLKKVAISAAIEWMLIVPAVHQVSFSFKCSILLVSFVSISDPLMLSFSSQDSGQMDSQRNVRRCHRGTGEFYSILSLWSCARRRHYCLLMTPMVMSG